MSSEPIAEASSEARAQLPAHSSYSKASRIAGSRSGSSRRHDPISCRAWSDRPDPSSARARSSSGMAGCPQSSSAAMPGAHGCPAVVPCAAAVSTASATRSITAGLASQGTRVTARPAASTEMHPSASPASPASSRPRGPSSGCVSSHRGMPARAARPRRRIVTSAQRRGQLTTGRNVRQHLSRGHRRSIPPGADQALMMGRKVMRVSPAEPSPGDPPAGVPVHSPVPRPGDRRHDIEPVRPPVVAQPVTPRPSGVLHLDPEAVR